MWRRFGSGAFITAMVLLQLSACRPKAKPAPAKATASTASSASELPKSPPPPNQRYFESKAVDLVAMAPKRSKAKAAFERTLDKHAGANDSMAALARALFEAPGSAVAAVELAKAARRAHDPYRFSRYARIAERAAASFPSVAKAAEAVLRTAAARKSHADSSVAAKSGPSPTREISGVARLEDVCGWLSASFKQGHPPVEYVGEQDTAPIECQLSVPQNLARELQAATAVVRLGTTDERVFAWIAVRVKDRFWLSPVVAESFAPAMHPYGNGFSIELQRTEAYKAGLPELTVYVADRSTVLDLILNELVAVDRHRIVVMTFDGAAPQTSDSIVVHSKMTRSLIDPSEPHAPKGYVHSNDLGRTTEETFRIEWGDNQVRLVPTGSIAAKSKVVALFTDT